MRTIRLSHNCDRAAAAALHSDLCQAVHDGDVLIDGSDVTRLGQAMMQLLISARLTAERLGNELRMTASPAMTDTLRLAGFETLVAESEQP